MPNSRTPKKILRPAGSSWKFAPGLKIVFVEEVKSAAPPNSSGTASAIAFITAPPADARRLRLARRKDRQRGLPASLQLAPLRPLKLLRQLRKSSSITGKQCLPFRLCRTSALHRAAPIRQRRIGKVKALVLRKAEELLRRRHAFGAQRFAMRLVAARLWAAVANHRPHRNNRRPARLRLGRRNRRLNRRQIVSVRNPLHMPVVGLEALQRILGITQARRPIQRNLVVVVKKDQLAQPQRSGQRRRLVATRLPSGRRRPASHRCGDPPLRSPAGCKPLPGASPQSPFPPPWRCPAPAARSSPPRRPVCPRSGWPGVRDPHCRKLFRSSSVTS